MSSEQSTPEKLSELIKQLEYELAEVPEFSQLRSVLSDDRLARFLISKQLDLAKAKDMIVKHIEWRKQNDVETWREYMKDKPFLTKSFPHESVLRAKGLGMIHTAVHAGLTRTGELVMIEILGAEGQTTDITENQESLLKILMEYYTGFYEKRSMVLEEMSKTQGRRVCTVQLRDVSKLSFMPSSGTFSVVQRIMSTGMNNYPESASSVLFLSPPTIFSGIFGIVKRWLPEDVNKKFCFVAKQDIGTELLRYVRPAVVVALQDLHNGNPGDEICESLINERPIPQHRAITTSMEITVAARDYHFLYYELGAKSYSKVSWTRFNLDESPKSIISAKIYYVDPSTESNSPESVKVMTTEIPGSQTFATMPSIPGVTEALLCLCLDHTSAWFQSHTFSFTVTTE